jgi:hypothetical protein
MRDHIHFANGFSSIEEVEEAHGPIWDATTLSKVATCPRYHQVRVEENLEPADYTGPQLAAGCALHLGLEYYYSSARRDEAHERMATEICGTEWDRWNINLFEMSESDQKKYKHYGNDFLAEVLRSYFRHWQFEAIEIYEPIAGLTVDQLNLKQVLAARFPLNHKDEIILGESKLVMRFDVDGEELVLAGKPDLPVRKQTGDLWSMDHKTSLGYLSDWWVADHMMSNKDRGYMAMLGSLLGKPFSGTVINGIHLGEAAHRNPKSTATRFARFEFDFSPDHVTEALRNQLAWRKTVDFYRQQGYFPQGCGFGGCKMPSICRRDPPTRDIVKQTDWKQSTRTFWEL